MSGTTSGGSDTPIMLPLLLFFGKDIAKAKQQLAERMLLTYKCEKAVKQNEAFAELFHVILNGGGDIRQAIITAFNKVREPGTMDLVDMCASDEPTEKLFPKHFQIS